MFASRIVGAVATLLTFAVNVTAIPTITTLGNKFFDSDGKQFFVKGKIPIPCTLLLTGTDEMIRYRIPIGTRRSTY